MTMTAMTQPVKLPAPNYPMVTRMLSKRFFPDMQKQVVSCPHCKGSLTVDRPVSSDEPVQWILGDNHPLVPNTKIERMFMRSEDGVVEVYSVTNHPEKGALGIRNLVPVECVLLVEEGMPFDVFAEELESAEEVPPPVATGKPEAAAAANGQPS